MTGHLYLFDLPIRLPVRDSEPADIPRLERLLDRVRAALLTGREWTLRELADHCGGSEASVSARIRDCRRKGLTITKRRHESIKGLWLYKKETNDV